MSPIPNYSKLCSLSLSKKTTQKLLLQQFLPPRTFFFFCFFNTLGNFYFKPNYLAYYFIFVYVTIPEPKPPPIPAYPCQPSPCGANSECAVTDGRPVCLCLPGMLGTPPHCRPECLIHADCPTKLACLNNKCRDPCIGSCGLNAQCTVISHQPVCTCNSGFHGDPFSSCNPEPQRKYPATIWVLVCCMFVYWCIFVHWCVLVPSPNTRVIRHCVNKFSAVPTSPPEPCIPSPCGPNAICKELHGAGSCTCTPGYFGDPYLGCRPECVQNSDCLWNKACVNNKCVDPCSGACGLNAECKVVHHSPSCFCFEGYTGNPLSACRKIPLEPSKACAFLCGDGLACGCFLKNVHLVVQKGLALAE